MRDQLMSTNSTPSRQAYSVSPGAESVSTKKGFRHNPYAFDVFTGPAVPTLSMAMPEGTRHPSLWGRVSFVPFPTESFFVPEEAQVAPGAPMVRVFIGQLPYFMTDMELAWIVYTLGGGQVVLGPERIMKRQSGGERLPTGCIHGYATEEGIATMALNMHKRVLVDDTGMWHAQDERELLELSQYVADMKMDKALRVPGRPYDTVVVQQATSNFVPACPVPLSAFPTERAKPQRASPPPPYGVAPPAYQQHAAPCF